MKKMNILIVGSDLSVKGGMVSVIKNYLSYEGWQKSNIYFEPSYIEEKGIKKIIFFMRAFFRIRRRIKEDKIHIVHLHVSERGSFYRKAIIQWLVHRKKCKAILHHHGAEFFEFYNNGFEWQKKLIRYVVNKADLNLVLSYHLVEELKKIVPDAKVEALYNAVPCCEQNCYRNGRNLLMLGRLEERKGTYDLLMVLKKLDQILEPDIKINLCGDGNLERLTEKIRELGLCHRVKHVGWIDKEKKEQLFEETMVHILFSYHEGLPMAILETMSYGIPNISTKIASIPEVIVSGETGVLVEAGDRDALEKALIELCQDSQKRKNISENSWKLIHDKFSLKQHIQTLEKFYYELLN